MWKAVSSIAKVLTDINTNRRAANFDCKLVLCKNEPCSRLPAPDARDDAQNFSRFLDASLLRVHLISSLSGDRSSRSYY